MPRSMAQAMVSRDYSLVSLEPRKALTTGKVRETLRPESPNRVWIMVPDQVKERARQPIP